MKSFVRSWALAALAVFAAVCVNNTTKAGITYDLVNLPSEQTGYNLTGSITTNGTLGGLSSSDIVSWLFSVTNGTNTYSNSSTADGYLYLANVTATSSDLLVGSSGRLLLGVQTRIDWIKNVASYAAYASNGSGGSFNIWHRTSPSFSVDGSSWIVATAATPSNVPEIDLASFGSAFALLIGSLGLVERRARRTIGLINSAA